MKLLLLGNGDDKRFIKRTYKKPKKIYNRQNCMYENFSVITRPKKIGVSLGPRSNCHNCYV